MLLAVAGDVHLGRSSSRIRSCSDKSELRSAEAWLRAVDLAVSRKADIFCLTGDIADRANMYWESIGPLITGIKRLADNGILAVAVAGNHDYDVLPKIAKQFRREHFALIGTGGTWERLRIRLENGEVINIDGWSFPSQEVVISPLDSYELKSEGSTPTIGMIHGDTDSSFSKYAPLDLDRLLSLGSGNWLLGHIHAPRLVNRGSFVLYPGSLQALDPGEPGPHGLWFLELQNEVFELPKQFQVSSVWYDTKTIDLTGVTSTDELTDTLMKNISMEVNSIQEKAAVDPFYLSLRLTLTGQTPVLDSVEHVSSKILEDLELYSVTIDKIDNQTIPPIDLEQYAGTQTAAGAVAKLLLQLKSGDVSAEPASSLIREVLGRLTSLDISGRYGRLHGGRATPELATKHLESACRALLAALVAQNNNE